MTSSEPFKWRHFKPEIILLNVRWYLRYSLSYRDLEEVMLERGLKVDHSTICRWVYAYLFHQRNLRSGCIIELDPQGSSLLLIFLRQSLI